MIQLRFQQHEAVLLLAAVQGMLAQLRGRTGLIPDMRMAPVVQLIGSLQWIERDLVKALGSESGGSEHGEGQEVVVEDAQFVQARRRQEQQ